jgi:transposase InsO family protein
VGTLDYLPELAKDWARYRFATAKAGDFTLAPCRFELRRIVVRRSRVPRGLPEAESPLSVAERTARPTAWCRRDVTMVVTATDAGTVRFEQEIVEVLAIDGDELLAEAALVARVPGLPPCLGRFRPIS